MNSRRVLLVGWDAADWKVIRPLMAAGEMPHVQGLVENGASGQVATLHPPLSPMLWTSIATGKRPFKHGIHGFSEPTPDGRGVQPVTNLSRTSKALWNILNQNDLRSVVIGWWPSHPAEPIEGVMVSDHFHRAFGPMEEGWPLVANAVHPPELAEILAGLRMHPDQLTPAMVEPFIPLAQEIDQENDKRLAALLRTLAECMSVQAAAEWLMERDAWDFFAVYFDAIDHFSHGFMKYHAPRQSWIGERDFELYHNVVSMAYQLHDRMLGTLLEKAGEDVTVILMSDHGFHPDHLRPASIPDIPAGPAIEHRDFGILAVRGPGIKQGAPLHGASVLDIAPTILTLYGLPVGEDMDGKVLTQAFMESPMIESVASWEDIAGADGRHPPHTRLDPLAAHAALEQMIALGYIERPDDDSEVAVRKSIRELRYNLGESYQDAGRHDQAHAIFSELRAVDPEEQRFAVRLFVSAQALGKIEEMRRIAGDLERSQSPVADYLNAQVLMGEKRYPEALSALAGVPGVLLETAELYLRLGHWRSAQKVFEQALEIDPDDVHARLGLCRIALRRRKFNAAAHAALDALQRTHHDPRAHFLLGLALTGMRGHEGAAEAFRAAASLSPDHPESNTILAANVRPEAHARPVLERSKKLERAADGLPVDESLIVVTGLPRSGTSMIMQMLAAGGMDIVSDGIRKADASNPRGYLEYEPVKTLWKNSEWLRENRGKAVKIVAPLLPVLPAGLPCRVILCERDLEEVLDSQERMLARKGEQSRGRRDSLRSEYARLLDRVRTLPAKRPCTHLLTIEHGEALADPLMAAGKLNRFLDGGLDVAKMAAAVGL
jgi:predicted AlkP superfamily phosphohydrolase/phosphomutase/Tfp pilus assembly protein PilF